MPTELGLTTCHLIHAVGTATVDPTTRPTGGAQMRDAPDLTRIDLREPDGTTRMAEALRQQGIALFSGCEERIATATPRA